MRTCPKAPVASRKRLISKALLFIAGLMAPPLQQFARGLHRKPLGELGQIFSLLLRGNI
ncbi:MAG: hypothetical protein ACK564_05970 [Novosphingobium sp.]|jgi:hypothetical protein